MLALLQVTAPSPRFKAVHTAVTASDFRRNPYCELHMEPVVEGAPVSPMAIRTCSVRVWAPREAWGESDKTVESQDELILSRLSALARLVGRPVTFNGRAFGRDINVSSDRGASVATVVAPSSDEVEDTIEYVYRSAPSRRGKRRLA